MIELRDNGVLVASYAYNGKGERVRKTTGSVTTDYVYDEGGQLIGEYTGSHSREYVWLADVPVAMIETTSTTTEIYYLYVDHLNTPRFAADASGTVVWRWDSDPFGNGAANEDPDADTDLVTVNLRFPGQQFDAESGTHYNYFRDYDPVLGRYLQSDPIGLAGGLNTYGYAYQNPIKYTDPSGLWVPQVVGGLVNMGFEGYNQYLSGNLDINRLLVAGATGALGGFGSTAIRSIGFGGAAGMLNAGCQEFGSANAQCHSNFDSSRVVDSALLGATGGIVGFGVGKFGRNRLRSLDVIGSKVDERLLPNYSQSGAAIGAAVGVAIGNQ